MNTRITRITMRNSFLVEKTMAVSMGIMFVSEYLSSFFPHSIS